MSHLHLAIPMCALSVAAPQVDRDIAASWSLEPHPRAAKPPHSYSAWLHLFCLDLLIQPGSPFRECTHDPVLSCNLCYFAHKTYLLFFYMIISFVDIGIICHLMFIINPIIRLIHVLYDFFMKQSYKIII